MHTQANAVRAFSALFPIFWPNKYTGGYSRLCRVVYTLHASYAPRRVIKLKSDKGRHWDILRLANSCRPVEA